MSSYPSSLQDHSDIPTLITSILLLLYNLISAYLIRSYEETLGLQVLLPLSFSSCREPYPGSSAGAHAIYFPANIGAFSSKGKDRRVVRPRANLSRNQTLPAIPVWPDSRGCTLRFMLRPEEIWQTPLTGYNSFSKC